MTHNFISTLPLSFSSRKHFQCLRPKSPSVEGWYPATPGMSQSRQNFPDSSSDSDSGQNSRLRPTPTSGLGSDSAALVPTELLKQWLNRWRNISSFCILFFFQAQFIDEWRLTIVRYLADMASVKACQLKPIPSNPSIIFQWKHTRAVLVSNTSLKMHGWVRTARRNLGLNTCVDVTSIIYPFNVRDGSGGAFRRAKFAHEAYIFV